MIYHMMKYNLRSSSKHVETQCNLIRYDITGHDTMENHRTSARDMRRTASARHGRAGHGDPWRGMTVRCTARRRTGQGSSRLGKALELGTAMQDGLNFLGNGSDLGPHGWLWLRGPIEVAPKFQGQLRRATTRADWQGVGGFAFYGFRPTTGRHIIRVCGVGAKGKMEERFVGDIGLLLSSNIVPNLL